MRKALARTVRALATAPDGRAWFETIAATVAFFALVVPPALSTGLLEFTPRPLGEAALVALIALPVPAMAEEIVFRGAVPHEGETKRPMGWILGSTLAFLLWHVAEGFFLPGAGILLRGDILIVATGLGLACAFLRYRTGSLWPPILLHWVVAGSWLALFGGPSIRSLLS